MDQQQAQRDIAIIKDMIVKSRRDTADFGPFLIAIGFFSLVLMLAMAFLPKLGIYNIGLPLLIVMFVGNGVIGFLTVNRWLEKAGVRSYVNSVFLSIWAACGIVGVLILFVFPLTGVYPYPLVPVICNLIVGIGFFATGALYEIPFVQYLSFLWWGGACMMAYSDGMTRVITMTILILLGFILPGYLVTRNFRTRSESHEAR